MFNVLKGTLIALATLVPGVSGGTMMIILDVYDDTIRAMSSLISGKLIHKKLMLQLIIGALIGFVFFSRGLEWAIAAYPGFTSFLFLGIIVAGIGIFITKIDWKNFKWFHSLFLIGGLLIAIITTTLDADALIEGNVGLPTILIAGIVIAVALILPGISTSFLLLSLGLYDNTLRAFSTLDFGYLVPLGVGVLIGILLTTRILEYCMDYHPIPTYTMILGFIVGSVESVFPGVPVAGEGGSSLFSFVIGILMMFGLQKISKTTKEKQE